MDTSITKTQINVIQFKMKFLSSKKGIEWYYIALLIIVIFSIVIVAAYYNVIPDLTGSLNKVLFGAVPVK